MRILRTLGASTVLALTVALAALSLSPSSADAAPAAAGQHGTSQRSAAPDYRNYFGAIVMSHDGAIGYGYNYRTRGAAYNRAFRGCRTHSSVPGQCRKIGWVENGCGAVAVKYASNGLVSYYHYGHARTRSGAKAAAKRGFGGQIRGWVCTAR